MTHRTTFRITIALLLLVGGAVFFMKKAESIQAQSIIDTVVDQVNATTKTVTNAEQITQNTEATETLEESAEKGIEQVKKYLDPSRVQGVLKEMFSNHYGIVGEVQRINDDALTIKNVQGTTILSLGSPEISITKSDESIALKDIAVGNWVTILGYKDAEDFAPKAVIVSAESPRPDPQLVMLGMITDITAKSLTVRDRATSEERTFVITRSSTLEDSTGEEATLSDFDADVTVLVVATSSEDSEEYEVVTLRSLAALDELN